MNEYYFLTDAAVLLGQIIVDQASTAYQQWRAQGPPPVPLERTVTDSSPVTPLEENWEMIPPVTAGSGGTSSGTTAPPMDLRQEK